MPFISSPSLPVARRKVAVAFPHVRSVEYELKAFGFTAAFYALYVSTALDAISAWPFVVAGPFLLIRSFNALHETFHAGSVRLDFLRWLAIVVGPVQFGYDQYRAGHHSHHSHAGSPDDIEGYLVRGSLPAALLNAFTQPEQALFHYLRRRPFDAKLGSVLALNACIYAGMMALGWGWAALLYNVVARVGNTFTWFTFHWVLHHPRCTDGLAPLPLPRALGLLWWATLGPDNLAGSTHHELHHAYPGVPDSRLTELWPWLSRQTSAAPALSAERAAV
jgi:fatty acid desaturase